MNAPEQNLTISELCAEDKAKVAHLIRQLSKCTSEIKTLQAREAQREHEVLKEISRKNEELDEIKHGRAQLSKQVKIDRKQLHDMRKTLKDKELEMACQTKYITKITRKSKKMTNLLKAQEQRGILAPTPNAINENDEKNKEKEMNMNEENCFKVIQQEINLQSVKLQNMVTEETLKTRTLRNRLRMKMTVMNLDFLKELLNKATNLLNEQFQSNGCQAETEKLTSSNIELKQFSTSCTQTLSQQSSISVANYPLEKVETKNASLIDIIKDLESSNIF